MSLTASTQLRATLTSAMLLLASFTSAQNADDSQPPPAFVVAPFDTDRTGWMPPPRLGETLAERAASLLAIQGSDGDRARSAVRTLRALIDR